MQDNMQQMLTYTIDNLKVAMDSQNVVCQPIRLEDGSTIIPMTKITVGFASGGGEYATNATQTSQPQFAGGGGGGLTMFPVGYVVCKYGEHHYKQLDSKEKDNKWMDLLMATIKVVMPKK